MEFKNKVVIVTGASSGIGKALAEKFSQSGAKVVLSARNRSNLELTGQGLTGEYLIIPADVSKEEDCLKLIEGTIEKFGKIDFLVNNAGISMRAQFKDVELDVIRQLMDINFYGTLYCTKYALPYLLSSKGSIVGVSSIAGFRGLPGRTGYSASKFAMHGFLEALRTELLNENVNVLLVCPGFTRSNIRKTALNEKGMEQGESPRNEEKMMSAEKVAELILQAIKKRKRTLVLTTQGKLTVFFNKWLPGWMDKKVLNHFKKEG